MEKEIFVGLYNAESLAEIRNKQGSFHNKKKKKKPIDYIHY